MRYFNVGEELRASKMPLNCSANLRSTEESYWINYAAILARHTPFGYPEVKWFTQPTSKVFIPR
jgi:hypothetical protein